MSKNALYGIALAVVTASLVGGGLSAQEPQPMVTKITVPAIHCAGCAKGIEAKLAKVDGVARVATDVPTKTLFVVHKGQVTLSPKVLWETVESAGKQPSRLEGPSGTFATKPKF